MVIKLLIPTPINIYTHVTGYSIVGEIEHFLNRENEKIYKIKAADMKN